MLLKGTFVHLVIYIIHAFWLYQKLPECCRNSHDFRSFAAKNHANFFFENFYENIFFKFFYKKIFWWVAVQLGKNFPADAIWARVCEEGLLQTYRDSNPHLLVDKSELSKTLPRSYRGWPLNLIKDSSIMLGSIMLGRSIIF